MEDEMRMVCIAAMLMACTGDSGDDNAVTSGETGNPVGDCASADMELTLGAGLTSFTPLAADDELTIVHGPQGGWHIEVAGELRNAGQEVAILPSFKVASTGAIIAGDQQEAYTALASYDDPTCTGQFFGIRAFVDDFDAGGMSNQQFICSLDGETLEMSIVVTDLDNGQSVTETLMVTARNDELDATTNCP